MSKKALLIGINKFSWPGNDLNGCINDTIEMKQLLQNFFDFEDNDIQMLHDSDATNQGIREGLGWLFSDYEGEGRDVRVFHFSSHGTQVEDQEEGDEWEGFDEVIVPYDHDWDNPFRDDHLREIFDTIPQDVNFTFIADCCHSGSIQREIIDREIEFKPRFLTPPREIRDGIVRRLKKRSAEANAWAASQLAQMLKDVSPDQWEEKMKEYLELLIRRFRENKYGIIPTSRHVLLAACEDRQTAADAYIEGDYHGAFSWALGKAIKDNNGDLTYDNLITQAGSNLENYSQIPQLECPSNFRNLKNFAPLAE